MKTKLRRISKRTLALILCSLMLLSALGIGTWITANAASSTYTVYFRNNANWSNVYVLTGSNLNMEGSSGAYKNLYGPNINKFTAMSLVPGETNVYKASVTVYDNKIAFASANSTQSGYYASSGSICCVGNMSSGKVCNVWTDDWISQNGAAYKKYDLEDYTPPAINITGINGEWTTGDGLTLDSGNNYYYSFTGDGYDKYFRFKIGSTYYEAYDNDFDLENGSDGPYDGTTDAKKYGARSGNENAFKLTASTGYTYKIYFDISGKKAWYTKTARTTAVTLDRQSGTGGSSSVTATYGSAMPSATMPTRTGYTFNGYYTSTGGSGTKYYNADGTSANNWNITDASRTLYAYWTANTYDIRYTGSNVSYSSQPTSGTYNSTVSFSVSATGSYVLGEVTGTYTDGSGSHTLTISGSNGTYSFTQPAGNVSINISTILAPKTVTVTKGTGIDSYVVNGNTYTDSSRDFTVSSGDSFTITTVNYSTGYEDDNNTLSIASVTSNQTIALTAKKTSYTITKATATNGSFTVKRGSTAVSSANYGDTITITPTANTNYTVDTVKYNDGLDHTITYNSGYSFTMPAHDVTVTVTFKEAKYTVTVKTENSAKGMVGNNVTSTTVSAGNVNWVTLPAATPKSGYVFNKWEITTNSGNGTLYNDTDATQGAIKATGACTVTAKFTEVMNAITVQPEYCGVEPLGTVNPVSGSAGVATSLSVSATARTGYEFLNWTGENLTFASATTASTSLTASAAGTATANYKPTKLYLDISGNTSWRNQTIKIYYFSNGSSYTTGTTDGFVTMSAVAGETDLYVGDIPSGFYENKTGSWGFIFLYGDWVQQSQDLQFDGKKNRYAITSTKVDPNDKKYTGSWNADAFILETKYDVTVNSGAGGTVTFNTTTEVAANSNETVSVGATARSLVAAPQAGYHFVSWSTTGGASVASTTSASTTITATAAGTVTATFAQDVYTVSLSGSNCTLNTYSNSGMTTTKTQFNYGKTVYWKLTPATGYRITSIKIGDGTTTNYTDPADTNYKSGNFTITGNTTITVTTVQVYSVTLTRRLNNSSNTTPFATTQYKLGSSGTYATYSSAITVDAGTEVYFKITYTAGYEYNTISNATFVTNYTEFKTSAISAATTVIISAKKTNYTVGASISSGSVSGNTIQFKKSTASTYSNTLTNANVGDTINIKVTTAENYYLTSFTASAGTAPSIPSGGGNGSNYTMNYTMTASSVTFTAAFSQEATVNFNIDMHGNTVDASNALSVKITPDATSTTAVTDHTGASCSIASNASPATLTKQGSSTVYSGNVTVPLTADTIYFVVTYKDKPYKKSLTKTQISGGTVWLEAANDMAVIKRAQTTTNTSYFAPSDSTQKRIYLAVPNDWSGEWTSTGYPKIYYWGDTELITWDSSETMTSIGSDSNYKYYYRDITQNAKHLIFRGSDRQTENIMNISTNYFKLTTSDGKNYGTPQTAATVPTFSKYISSVTMNKGETQSIVPTMATNCSASYSTSNSSVATVNSSGVVTAKGSGTATITVKVKGSISKLVSSPSQDILTYTVAISVSDPEHFNGFNIMSLATRTSTITIPQVGETQPGYFDSAPSVTVTGTPSAPTAGYTNSAIVSPSDNAVTGPGVSGKKYKTYTVKYAAPSTFSGYTGITVTANEIVSKSIHYNDEARYGYKQWKKGTTVQSYTVTKSVTDGVETAVTKNFELTGATYSEIFETYSYVDVTFNFDYYEYKTLRTVDKLDAEGNRIPILDGSGNPTGQYETEQKNFYFYDPEWVGADDSRAKADTEKDSTAGLVHYVQKTYTVTDFEVRYKTADAISASNYDKKKLVGDAGDAIGNKPDNNYYNYTINASTIKDITKNSKYKATVKVEMTHTPKTYKVKWVKDGSTTRSEPRIKNMNDGSPNYNTYNYYYQEYANLTNGTSLNWILTDSGNSYTGPTLYTGRNYKFRVTGDTYLKTAAGSIADDEFNRSKVNLANQEITHEPKSTSNPTVVEKLINNFYIADFFDPDKVLNDRGLKEDDVKFVGGGVLYYQVKDGVPAQKAVDGGYVNGDSGSQNYGLADADAIKDFIKEKIEAGLENTSIVPNDIEGTDDRMAIAYGYNYDAQKDGDTDIFYRYLPYEVYKRTNGGDLEKAVKKDDQGNIVYEQDGETPVMEYTFATDRQSNAYRYSNALKAYQYIYASKQENKITNEGKDMRLYAYYIYSYTKYDQDTGIPETVYKVVLSDQPANASTYFDSTP